MRDANVPPLTVGPKVSLLLAPLGHARNVGAALAVSTGVAVGAPGIGVAVGGATVGTGHAGTLKFAGVSGADGVPLLGHGDSGLSISGLTS
jgi:hypothetical protein